MSEIKFNEEKSEVLKNSENLAEGYSLVETVSGNLTCSCGRELIRVSEDMWRCSGGYPQWRISEREVFKDKFGNLYLKPKDHGKSNAEYKRLLNADYRNKLGGEEE